MEILALEPYYGGSHKAFLDEWSVRSRHHWTILHLPPSKWKWRMRHAAITFADEVNAQLSDGKKWDILFCSDILNLAEFLGLADEPVRRLPSVAYFHENQLTYPDRHPKERDHHFVVTNLTTCLAATAVWFNSKFHRESFLEALPTFLRRMPDYRSLDTVKRVRRKSYVFPQGVTEFSPRGHRKEGPIRILWAARWEHDKRPDVFFQALNMLKQRGIEFRVSVIGQQFEETPPVFMQAKKQFRDEIERWGYQRSRGDYIASLQDTDVVVSTADHEFFGVSVVEAIAAGAYPLLPRRLAYPEILNADETADLDEFFYDGSPEELADRLTVIADRVKRAGLWENRPRRLVSAVARFSWKRLAPQLDDALAHVTGEG